MRVAVIDLGTNSSRLLLAEVGPDGLLQHSRRTRITGLGRGSGRTGRLTAAAMGRVLSAVEEYLPEIEAFRPEIVRTIGTSALREAVNADELGRALAERGLCLEVVSGEREAGLMYAGALSGRAGRLAPPLLVVDIGGGSTELCLGQPGSPLWYHSLPLGCVRNSQAAGLKDPAGPVGVALLQSAVEPVLAGLPEPPVTPASVVGLAGTLTSLAAWEMGMAEYDPERVDGYFLSHDSIARAVATFSRLPVSEIARQPGIQPGREALILAGAVIALACCRRFELNGFSTAESDILDGAALASAGFGWHQPLP